MLALAAGCASPLKATQSNAGVPQAARTLTQPSSGSPIEHIIVVVQENRSFDNMFNGFPGADTVTTGAGKHGTTYTLQKVPLVWRFDLRHDHPQFLEDYDQGKNDGFENEIAQYKKCTDPINHPGCWIFYNTKSFKQMAYSYVDPQSVVPYWTMAHEYALGDKMFSSNNGPSFVSHQYLIAAQSGHSSEVPNGVPWGCDANPSITVEQLAYGRANPPVFSRATGHEIPGPQPCFTYPTIADLLDAAKVTWRYYVMKPPQGDYLLSPFDAIRPIRYGPDWSNVVNPDTAILTDIANNNLQQVSWVMPTGTDDDHPGHGTDRGPQWVASIVNAVGQSPYWKNTAIVVTWDEWGGWYDHVVPPQLMDPITHAYEGLGFRVPVIVISPYAKAGYISHTQHEMASTLRLIEETFGLPSLGLADTRADGFDDMFNFSQTAIPFRTIPTVLGPKYFLNLHDDSPSDTD